MIDYATLIQACTIVFQLDTLVWLCVGVGVGIGVGAMPGLQATTAIALMLPLTFNMSLGPALGLLIGLYKGATYGGAISAITFSTPGTPESAATVLDGYKLMQRGHGRKAMLMALYASVTADLLSDVLTIVLAPVLAVVALKFGPSERFWVMILAITLVGALSGKHMAKGLFSAAIGLFLGTIGTDPIGFVSRNTFGLWWLSDGIPFSPMLIGIFAMGMVFSELMSANVVKQVATRAKDIGQALSAKPQTLTWREYVGARKEIAIGFGVGSIVGLLPGLGGAVGAFLAYAAARFASPHKGIGTGKLEGVAAAEAGNNATVGPTLVPLLAFGIPGSTAAALIGGALVLQGATPSPRMFELYPHVIYALFIILIIGNFANLGFGRAFSFVYAKLGQVPKVHLVPAVGVMAVVGAYAYEQNSYHVLIMLAFGLVGLVFRIVRIPEAPLVITFVLAPLAEENMRRALLIGGDWTATFFNGPLSIGLIVATILSLLFATRIRIHDRIATMRTDQRDEMSDGQSVLSVREQESSRPELHPWATRAKRSSGAVMKQAVNGAVAIASVSYAKVRLSWRAARGRMRGVQRGRTRGSCSGVGADNDSKRTWTGTEWWCRATVVRSVVWVLIAVMISNVSAVIWSQFLRTVLVRNHAMATEALVQNAASVVNAKAYFSANVPDVHGLLVERWFDELSQLPELTAVTVFAVDGTITWASKQQYTGLRRALVGHLARAMGGEMVVTDATLSSQPSIELYVPVRFGELVLGVVKLEQTPLTLRRTLVNATLLAWLGVMFACCCFAVCWLRVRRRSFALSDRRNRAPSPSLPVSCTAVGNTSAAART